MKTHGSFGYEVFSLSQDFKSEIIQLQHKVLSQFLCHRSGKNISNLPRMSLQVRFSDLEDTFFNEVIFNFSKENNLFSYSEALKYISGHMGKE